MWCQPTRRSCDHTSLTKNGGEWLARHSLLTWLLFVCILALRRPGVLLHSQFWAEDGPVWYGEAYADGWRALLHQHSGYLQTISRLTAAIAQAMPLTWAPTVFAAVALAFQAMPSTLLVSERFETLWPDRTSRLLFASLILVLSNSGEAFGNLTDTQWHLALFAFLSIVGSEPGTGLGRKLDLLALLLAGLSGPFCVFLLPIAIWQGVEDRNLRSWTRASILGGCVGLQATYLFGTMNGTRSSAPLGASVATFSRIVTGQIELGSIVGAHSMSILAGTRAWNIGALPLLGVVVGVILLMLALKHGSSLLRKAVLAGGLLLAAALLKPQVSATQPQWEVLTHVGAGNRYFFLPMLVWLAICFTLARHPARLVRWPVAGVLCLLPIGILGDLARHALPPSGFTAKAALFNRSPIGTTISFKVQPLTFPAMTLTKK